MSRLRVLLSVVAFAATTLSCHAADRIVLTRIGPTRATLFISNADGSGERALTQGGFLDYDPAWSPKGNWIAFTSERAGSADLYRIHPDGTGLDRLTDNPAYDDQAAFSPDGRQIVFVSTRAAGFANLWILNTATRRTRPLTSGHGGDFRPAWSPDGRWIAFSSDRASDFPPAKGRWERMQLVDIYIVHPDGTGLKRISQHGNFCGSPQWTRNSRSVIAYCMSAEETFTFRVGKEDGETHLVQIDIASGRITPIAAGPGVKISPSVLPSGTVAYVRRRNPAPGVFYASGQPGPAGSDVNNPSWSPDGAHVVYSRFSLKKSTTGPGKLWSRDPDYELYATSILPAYDPSGKLMVTTQLAGEMDSSLVIFEEGKPDRILLHRNELLLNPQWSPDGRQILFGIGRFTSFLDFAAGGAKPLDPVNGGAQTAIINADGSGFHLVTSGENNNAFAAFAPDGKHIVYRTEGPGGDGLRIMDLDDHSITVLTSEWDNFPVWSPHGDLIAFIRRTGGNFQVFTIRPDGTDLKQLTDTHGIDAHLAWSPDGEWLAFTSSRMGFKDEALYGHAPQPYGEIFVMRKDGTHVEQLTDNQWEDGGPTWQPHKESAR